MNKYLEILNIMKKDKCRWEDAAKKKKEIKNLNEFLSN